jgi:aminoglycoside phosphotransferase (APT) family kinase protein
MISMQQKILTSDLKKAVASCFTVSDITSIRPFSKGYINRMYEVRLKKGKSCLVRVYNEEWKAEKEVFVYNDIRAHVDVPIPEVYCVDDTKKNVPFAFSVISKIPGKQIDINYKKYRNKRLFREAGEILAKLHSIRFPRFGWIVGNEIRPAFDSWRNFVWHDIELKLSKISLNKQVVKLIGDVEYYLNMKGYLLDIYKQPCLLHKDYHCSHILTDKDKVTGIIDVEWAIAGHNENDFMKMELWAFDKLKGVREEFFKGYLEYGKISDEYVERMKLYELWNAISMINISKEVGNKIWLDKAFLK